MRQVQKISDGTYVLESFLTPFQCELLIQMTNDMGYEDSLIGRQGQTIKMPDLRNNSRILWDDAGLAKMLWRGIQSYVPSDYFGSSPVGLNERFRFYRYHPGEFFGWHGDGSFRRENGEESVYTFLLYLSDSFEGGETEFRDVSITPKQGLACWFQHKKEHRGAEVRSGIKYVLRSDVMFTRRKWKR